MPDEIQKSNPTLSELAPRYLSHARVEKSFSSQTIIKYQDCLRQVVRYVGDENVSDYCADDVLLLKSRMLERQLSVQRQIGILAAFKGLLRFCKDQCRLPVLNPDLVTIPKRPRRNVVFLSPAEVERFLAAIPLETRAARVHHRGIRFRALVETLLGTAMRIAEVLSLDRDQIDLVAKEARIIGKGNKERVVFFTDRALSWLERYLELRDDQHPALFTTHDGRARLSRADIWRPFARYRKVAGITKPVTPHILRHTAATQLLFNGCPIGHIKEILGHERLETTCRYYLGLDHRAAKDAHQRYLHYPSEQQSLSLTNA